jgi:RNA polymerase sigma-54 factor
MPDDLPVDSVWEDVFDGSTSYSQGAKDDERFEYERSNAQGKSLHEYLTWQLELTPFGETDRVIATALIDSIDDNGYLSTTIDDIYQGLDFPEELEVEPSDVESVLHRIQCFDPIGVGARDLSECLSVQLRHMPTDTPYLKEAKILAEQYLGQLANRDFNFLVRHLKIQNDELQDIIRLIQSLNPRPGAQITDKEPEYIIPDVIVKKKKGRWTVELNPDTLPKIRINSQYAGMIRRADNSDDNTYLKNHLQEARWFLKSLQSRNETLLKVAKCIVERQRGFLEYGDEAMKPLVLRDVAEAVEMHESTVSRVTTQKFMHTPRGIYEFKYFFSSHVSTTDGGECSATAIRAIIKKFLAAENPNKPLSDSKIAELLMKQGIKVARRTVAKYRESMAIPPSNERKRLTKA